jgi:predicted GNAT family acetyltransferase
MSVVAGSLQEAEGEGVTRAILFTDNVAARHSYAALGFQQIGEYGMVAFGT